MSVTHHPKANPEKKKIERVLFMVSKKAFSNTFIKNITTKKESSWKDNYTQFRRLFEDNFSGHKPVKFFFNLKLENGFNSQI